MHTDKSLFDGSKYLKAEKEAALDYAQKMNILSLQKKTVGKKRKDAVPADNPYARDENAHRKVDQFGVTVNHEEEHYQAYLQALPVGRMAMLRGMQAQWDDYQAQVVALEGTFEKLNLADEEAQQRALEQRAADYATRVILGPDGASQDYDAIYTEFLLASPELQEVLEQSVANIELFLGEPHAVPALTPASATLEQPDQADIELLAADYADRCAAHCTIERNKDQWFEKAYSEYINAKPEKRIELAVKLEELEARLATSSSSQHATRHVEHLSFSSSSPRGNQPAQRMGVEEYIARANRVMPYLSEEELKQNYTLASKSNQEFAGLIETLQELESEDPRYRGGHRWF